MIYSTACMRKNVLKRRDVLLTQPIINLLVGLMGKVKSLHPTKMRRKNKNILKLSKMSMKEFFRLLSAKSFQYSERKKLEHARITPSTASKNHDNPQLKLPIRAAVIISRNPNFLEILIHFKMSTSMIFEKNVDEECIFSSR